MRAFNFIPDNIYSYLIHFMVLDFVETLGRWRNIFLLNISLRIYVRFTSRFKSFNPQIQFLHCITQHEGSGGDNQFSDGLAIAEQIKQTHPTEWQVLCNEKIQW